MATYPQISARACELGGRGIAPCHIAHVKADHGLTRGIAYNRQSASRRVKPCPASKRAYIEQALRDLGML